MNKNEVKVTINCLAYNHGKYITKMLESCIAQKTNFKFEIIVHDDASTDDTAFIIRKFYERYPDIVIPIFQTDNQYYKKDINILKDFMYKISRGQYIAFCEGDDFWIDENKLQEQVEYLDSHLDCSFVFSDADVIWENGNYLKDFFRKKPKKNIFKTEDIINITFIPTASIVARAEYVINVVKFGRKREVCGDLPLMLSLSLDGYGYYINKKLSAYRVGNPNSASGSIRNNRERLEETYNGHVDILEGFNEQTAYKWNEAVQQNIRIRRLKILMELNDYDAIKKEDLIEVLRTFSLDSRFRFFLKLRFNFIYSFLRNLRNRIRRCY